MKSLRGNFFKEHPEIKEKRSAMGTRNFDEKYQSFFNFISKLSPGQYFFIQAVCKKDPANFDLILMFCHIYHNVEFSVNMEIDEETGKVSLLQPFIGDGLLPPPNMFSKIVKSPRAWGISPFDI